ncbi:hypothetical protein BGZ57DRAFT_913160 [Hyaloscypha finlandica]|nr:hypothetical protein BGZ57DRAFT_913160 [Hyaloscypha finlandica]
MTSDNEVRSASAMAHHQACKLHEDRRTGMKWCSGTLRRGGTCLNKASGPSAPGVMPTCKIHRDQLRVPGWCKAPLTCGFECGRLFEWKPHGFQLCPSHREDSMICYFFKIPIEIRFRIYGFLFPDRAIPAPFVASSHLLTDGRRVYTEILLVNHQIHDEAANLLYRTRVFTIEVSENTLSICNLPNKYMQHNVSHYCGSRHCDNHAQQDQMQQRALIARQSISTQISHFNQLRGTSPTTTLYRPVEPVWDPPLNEKYFSMIQSFRIEILLGPSIADAEKRKALPSRLARYCDQLHKLIGRLQLIQRPIARLEIAIKFSNVDVERKEAFRAARHLLNPFRRLCKVSKPQVISITMNDFQTRETELLFLGWISSGASTTFANYLERWSKDLSGSQPSLKCAQVLDAYWKLENLMSSIKEHCYNAEPRFCQFAGLLQVARFAREANDLGYFRKIWARVVAIWFEYLDDQKDFQANVTRSIDTINSIIEKDS